ncbi:hypothetical protein [Aureimonas ureilytica]|uniref:hypothetical protein n=1 Tax=Aureimonas ureilytica TaxID=401562 RepID=UPI0012DD92F7|nr:hypothetical protein [Aureimonas ureilytica]
MSHLPTETLAASDETKRDDPNRPARVSSNQGPDENDDDAERKGGVGFQPSSLADVELEKRTDSGPEKALGQSVAERFGIDEKHLYHKPSQS